jgi:predicted alpha/beta-fold hydrolase
VLERISDVADATFPISETRRQTVTEPAQNADMMFDPPPTLRSPLVQTILASRLARQFDGVGSELTRTTQRVDVPCRDGIRLRALINPAGTDAPLIVLLHGWFGRGDSPYFRHAASTLHAAGYSVARLLLRDHGETAGLNPEPFHAGRIDEVGDAASWLVNRYGKAGAGALGFSLGGNFLIRLLAREEWAATFRAALAVCPLVDPAMVIAQMDNSWVGYRKYFIRKWQRALAEKQAAFPERYDFSSAFELSLAGSLTDYFVNRFTPFPNTQAYFETHTLRPSHLRRIRVPFQIIAAADDPVVPCHSLLRLVHDQPDRALIHSHGGHCGFMSGLPPRSALDPYAVSFFRRNMKTA